MSHSNYTFSSPTAVAVKQLELNGDAARVGRTNTAGTYPGTTVTLSRIDTATAAGEVVGDGGTPAAGDLLVVGVVCEATGGQAITPPAGWTTLTPITGLGTHAVLLSVFWKVATGGDITGSLAFTAAASGNLTAFEFSVPQATIDTGSPLVADAASVSAADVSSIDGPTVTARGSVFELVGSPVPWSVASRADGDNYFVNRALNGISGSGVVPGILGNRYYVIPGGWSIDEIRF